MQNIQLHMILTLYYIFCEISNTYMQALNASNPTLFNTIVNAVIVGFFSFGGIIYTQHKTQKRYESELTQKDKEMKAQKEFFNDMIIYMSNYPHEVHALIKLKDILNELLSIYEDSKSIMIPEFAYEKIKPINYKFQEFKNSPLSYYLNNDIASKINPIFKGLNEKYDTSHQNLLKIQINRHTNPLNNNQLDIIRQTVPKIDNRINEITRNEINSNK